jgi:hypothetical protein
VQVASPQHLLAMKVLAGRRRDEGDIRPLARRLGLGDSAAVLSLCAEVFPDEPVPRRSELLLEDLFGEAGPSSAP